MCVNSMIPVRLQDKYVSLRMEPNDWSELNRILGDENYRLVVLEYQANEYEALPRCNTIFGLCSCYDHGRCTCKEPCRNKIR